MTADHALVVACDDLDDAIEAAERAGFRLDAIGPADEPTWAELSRGGAVLVLDTGAEPGGPQTRALDRSPLVVPPTVATASVSHMADGDWKPGRAGMRYRDLIPDRYGGAYIGSHIHVPDGGPIPDYVHHHDIVHQLIYCHRGWVTVVYEDQGPPLTMRPGDCLLQPPGIRHRVLESSDDLYVIEVGCPAEHRTSVEHDLTLPTDDLAPERRFGGQRFVHHVADGAPWHDDPGGGQYQDTDLGEASGGLVTVRRHRGRPLTLDLDHDDDLRLIVVTDGEAALIGPDGSTTTLAEGSSATIPAGETHRLVGTGDGDRETIVLDIASPPPPRP